MNWSHEAYTISWPFTMNLWQSNGKITFRIIKKKRGKRLTTFQNLFVLCNCTSVYYYFVQKSLNIFHVKKKPVILNFRENLSITAPNENIFLVKKDKIETKCIFILTYLNILTILATVKKVHCTPKPHVWMFFLVLLFLKFCFAFFIYLWKHITEQQTISINVYEENS